MVAGSWAQWHPQVLIPSQVSYSSEEIWSTEISLPDNVDEVFRFKFIIDGEWMYNSGLPVIPNNHGCFDNYIKVCLLMDIFICFLVLILQKHYILRIPNHEINR